MSGKVPSVWLALGQTGSVGDCLSQPLLLRSLNFCALAAKELVHLLRLLTALFHTLVSPSVANASRTCWHRAHVIKKCAQLLSRQQLYRPLSNPPCSIHSACEYEGIVSLDCSWKKISVVSE